MLVVSRKRLPNWRWVLGMLGRGVGFGLSVMCRKAIRHAACDELLFGVTHSLPSVFDSIATRSDLDPSKPIQLQYTFTHEAVELLQGELPQLAALERQLLQQHSLATSSQEDSEGEEDTSGGDGRKPPRRKQGGCAGASSWHMLIDSSQNDSHAA